MEKCARNGYVLLQGMPRVLKTKPFARWQASEGLPDAALCKAFREMERGLVDADLGGSLYKKRMARPGGGKSGGFRTVLSARIGHRYVFLHGFAKAEVENITSVEARMLRSTGKALLELSNGALLMACETQELLEVCCEPYH